MRLEFQVRRLLPILLIASLASACGPIVNSNTIVGRSRPSTQSSEETRKDRARTPGSGQALIYVYQADSEKHFLSRAGFLVEPPGTKGPLPRGDASHFVYMTKDETFLVFHVPAGRFGLTLIGHDGLVDYRIESLSIETQASQIYYVHIEARRVHMPLHQAGVYGLDAAVSLVGRDEGIGQISKFASIGTVQCRTGGSGWIACDSSDQLH